MSSDGQGNWDYRAIARLLTSDRLRSYQLATSGDLDLALGLYEWNIEASASVLALTARVEVIVRNVFDRELRGWSQRAHGTPGWFDCAPLDHRGRRDIDEARRRATTGRRAEVHGKVVAELNFGFWRYLVASRYLTTLWIPGLANAFPMGPSDPSYRRREVESHLQRLTFVRNRAAHHEPIHRRDLLEDLDSALTLMCWVSVDAYEWVRAKQRIAALCTRKPGATANCAFPDNGKAQLRIPCSPSPSHGVLRRHATCS